MKRLLIHNGFIIGPALISLRGSLGLKTKASVPCISVLFGQDVVRLYLGIRALGPQGPVRLGS